MMEIPASKSEPNWPRTRLRARVSTSGVPPATRTTYNGSSYIVGGVFADEPQHQMGGDAKECDGSDHRCARHTLGP